MLARSDDMFNARRTSAYLSMTPDACGLRHFSCGKLARVAKSPALNRH